MSVLFCSLSLKMSALFDMVFVRLYFESLIILRYVFRISELNIGENKFFLNTRVSVRLYTRVSVLVLLKKADIDL